VAGLKVALALFVEIFGGEEEAEALIADAIRAVDSEEGQSAPGPWRAEHFRLQRLVAARARRAEAVASAATATAAAKPGRVLSIPRVVRLRPYPNP
jgi:hypothetical protein